MTIYTRCWFLGLLTSLCVWMSGATPLAYNGGIATGTLSATNQWAYFEVNVPSGNEGWRLTLNATGDTDPNLYLQRGTNAPTTISYLKASSGQATDTLTLTAAEATPTNYVVGVHLPSGSSGPVSFTVTSENRYLTNLAWDPGVSDTGSSVHTNTSATGGEYFFRIDTENADLGMWRTALRVIGGEANLYLRQGALPTVSAYDYRSDLTGSDGVVRPLSGGAGQIWYILVKATAGAQWTLLSGDIFVTDLGPLAAGDSSGSGLISVPPEGIRYFKTTMPTETLAWRLWLQNAAGTATWSSNFQVRKALAPHPESASYYDFSRTGQTLLVPGYLVAGGSEIYYLSVPGSPGDSFRLDSRQQAVTGLAYGSTTTNTMLDGFLYHTYSVPVPAEQKAWQVSVIPVSGNPDFALRRSLVPNDLNNDAYSEIAGSVIDSATLVPLTLSDGTYYITVYSTAPAIYQLSNKEPPSYIIDFASSTPNPEPTRNGWVYFQLLNITNQLGKLGWLLTLTNQVSGSEIAIRRNAMPGRWNYRLNGTSNVNGYNFKSTTNGRLFDPDHEADIWYVGVYTPSAPLGNFTLTSGDIVPEVLPFESMTSLTNIPPSDWQFYRIDIPAMNNGNAVLGWELRVSDWGDSAPPSMVVRRDKLPNGITSFDWTNDTYPGQSTNWLAGNRWAAPGGDWTALPYNPSGNRTNTVSLLSMAMGKPLEPGQYYVGIYNGLGSTVTRCTLTSRGIGSGSWYVPVPVAFGGGAAATNLAPREVAYFAVDIPSNQPSWKVWLECTSGEAALLIRKDLVPTYSDGMNAPFNPPFDGYTADLRRTGDERYILTPKVGMEFLPAGRYYLLAVGQGQNPSGTRIGSGTSDMVLHTLGNASVTGLGALPLGGALEQSGVYAGGDNNVYTFTVPEGVLALTARLLDRVGAPKMAILTNGVWPRLSGAYGMYAESISQFSDSALVTIANPPAGTYSLRVADPSTANPTNGSYTVRIETVGAVPTPFDGASMTVTNLAPYNWRYYVVDVPATTNGQPVLGWELRVSDWAGPTPTMVVRRGALPSGTGSSGMSLSATNWPVGGQWATSSGDWTGMPQNPGGSLTNTAYLMSVAMGKPLEPGTYYIGLYNTSSSATMTNCTLTSRGVGDGLWYAPATVAFDGGSAATNLAPRDVAYFAVDIPSNQPSWKVWLECTSGEAALLIRKDWVPTYGNTSYAYSPPFDGYTVDLRHSGDERYILTSKSGSSTIPAGRYYLLAVSQGQNPSAPRIGAGISGLVLHSLSNAPVTGLGALPLAGSLEQAGSYAGGDNNVYTFTVPVGVLALEARLLDRVGSPKMAILTNGIWPRMRNSVAGDTGNMVYGMYAESPAHFSDSALITAANPLAGTYSLRVADLSSVNPSNGSYKVRIETVGAAPIPFDGASVTATSLAPYNWRYYAVDVPGTNNGQPVLGWELRVSDWAGATPTMVVRRGSLPSGTATGGMMNNTYPGQTTNWPAGGQWATAGGDWTGMPLNPSGNTTNTAYLLSMAMGKPLEPGKYYIGIYNNSANVTLTNYTLTSRGIGSGLWYEPAPVSFGGGAASANLAPRDVTYFSVDIPSNQPSWKVRLECASGEAALLIRKDLVPTYGDAMGATYNRPFDGYTADLRRSGDQYYTLSPKAGTNTIPAGRYYLLAAGLGQNPVRSGPSSGWKVGSGTSDMVLHSLSNATVTGLGTLPQAGTVERADSYAGGDNKLYTFTVPANVLALEVRLLDRVGDPKMAMLTNGVFPVLKATSTEAYGMYAAGVPIYTNWATALVTVTLPPVGTYTLRVADPSTASPVNGSYTVRLRTMEAGTLNVSAALNTNGFSNVATGLLADNQRAFFKIEVPSDLNGEPLLGWYPTLSTVSGGAQFRLYKSSLSTAPTAFSFYRQVLVPPLLTPGVWYAEVVGLGSAEFTFTSEVVGLERTWGMPAAGQPIATPGLEGTLFFGDTGVDTNGAALPIDQGVDLGNGLCHFYAVDVPAGNVGVLRTELQAISGNPNLYLRTGLLPTVDPVSYYDACLNNSYNTEYGNWVCGKTWTQLAPGKWYLLVKAQDANCRYRLKVSAGNIQGLSLVGGNFTGQNLASNDWRYYRVQIPLDVPTNSDWNITYSQSIGDVDLYLRDTVPPGNGATNGATSKPANAIYDSYYAGVGTVTVLASQIQPGHTYYLGFRANSDAAFSVSSALSGGDDSDGDGLPDAWERQYFDGSLAYTASDDPDGDGLNNLLEYQSGTNPSLADTDGDGMKDGAELEAGTDPLNAASVLKITRLGPLTPMDGLFYLPLFFQSVNAKAYVIQVAPAVTGVWVTAGASFVAVSNSTQVLMTVPESLPQTFYRVRLSAPPAP